LTCSTGSRRARRNRYSEPMSFVEILVMAFALSIDASAVSLAASTSGYVTDGRATFRLCFHFGWFQFLMPILGWTFGSAIAPIIEDFDHWIAFALLVFIALRMLRSASDTPSPRRADDPTRGFNLVILSIATSIDALVVGLSLAMLNISVWYPSAVIGIVTSLVCLAAIRLGSRMGAWLGRRAQLVGGVALILIAVRIVITHTT
jgi:putative Mn2+ efflux pump MntP